MYCQRILPLSTETAKTSSLPARDVDDAVLDERLALTRVLRGHRDAVQVGAPDALELRDVGGVDLVERRVALVGDRATVRRPVRSGAHRFARFEPHPAATRTATTRAIGIAHLRLRFMLFHPPAGLGVRCRARITAHLPRCSRKRNIAGSPFAAAAPAGRAYGVTVSSAILTPRCSSSASNRPGTLATKCDRRDAAGGDVGREVVPVEVHLVVHVRVDDEVDAVALRDGGALDATLGRGVLDDDRDRLGCRRRSSSARLGAWSSSPWSSRARERSSSRPSPSSPPRPSSRRHSPRRAAPTPRARRPPRASEEERVLIGAIMPAHRSDGRHGGVCSTRLQKSLRLGGVSERPFAGTCSTEGLSSSHTGLSVERRESCPRNLREGTQCAVSLKYSFWSHSRPSASRREPSLPREAPRARAPRP